MDSQESELTKLPLGLRYYILRGKSMVPMIPADQMPAGLLAVPRELTHAQLYDGNWKWLCDSNEQPTEFAPRDPDPLHHLPNRSSVKPTPFLAPDHVVRQSSPIGQFGSILHHSQPLSPAEASVPSQGSPCLPQIPDLHTMMVKSKPEQSLSMDSIPYDYQIPYPSGVEPDHTKKEYCTHWIKTGECAWLAIGCKYKHEMPNKVKLKELGFNQEPRWWKEKSRIDTRGLTWMQRRMANPPEDELSDEPSSLIQELDRRFAARKRMGEEAQLPVRHALLAASKRETQAKTDSMATPQQISTKHITPPPSPQPNVPNLIDLDPVEITNSDSMATLPVIQEAHCLLKPRGTFASEFSAHQHTNPTAPPISPIPSTIITENSQTCPKKVSSAQQAKHGAISSSSEDDRSEVSQLAPLRKKQLPKSPAQKRVGIKASKYAVQKDQAIVSSRSGDRRNVQTKSERGSQMNGSTAGKRNARTSRGAEKPQKTPTEG